MSPNINFVNNAGKLKKCIDGVPGTYHQLENELFIQTSSHELYWFWQILKLILYSNIFIEYCELNTDNKIIIK